MKRYVPALGTVLRARQLQEGLARAALQRANMAAAAAEHAASSALEHYRELAGPAVRPRGEDPSVAPGALLGQSLLADHELAALAAKAVTEASQAVSATRTEAVGAMGLYITAAQGVQALERLEERRREEHALATEREEAALVDEAVSARYIRQRRRTERGGPTR